MKCEEPIVISGKAFGCGRCLSCRTNRRRTWAHRIMLENTLHPSSVFVTLTYNDEKLPRTIKGLPTLEPKHPQDWLKRLRKATHPEKLRFYLVGEYGDETFRPHYHAAIFNYPACLYGNTRTWPGSSRTDYAHCCAACQLVGNTWGHGDIQLGVLEADSAGYLAGYVTKKMTRYDDPRLQGRWPEYARMSLRPGIGHDFMWDAASSFLEFNLQSQPDVPSGLRHGSKVYPLGRYLQKRYRTFVGRHDKAPEATIAQAQAEVQSVRESAFDNSQSFAEALKQDRKGHADKMKARSAIYKQRRTI